MKLGSYRACAKARQQMQMLLDASSFESLPQSLERHLEQCAACREMWRLFLFYENLLRAGRAQIPDAGDLLPAFHRRLAALPPSRRTSYSGKWESFPETLRRRWQLIAGLGAATMATMAVLWMVAARTLFLSIDRSSPAVLPPKTAGLHSSRAVKGSQSHTVALQQPSLAQRTPEFVRPHLDNQKTVSSSLARKAPQIALRTALPGAEVPSSRKLEEVSVASMLATREKEASPQRVVQFSGNPHIALDALMRSKPMIPVPMGSFGDQSLLDGSLNVPENLRHASAALMAGAFAAPDSVLAQKLEENAVVPQNRASRSERKGALPTKMAGFAGAGFALDLHSGLEGNVPIRLHVVDPRRGFTGTLQVIPNSSSNSSAPTITFQEALIPKTEGGQP
ncbi:hypothetical protein [Chthonomonas calidirosea]|uniref:hypothetical protein n=1 Tax=Chthonomonas calidirosea TaxID=454171 RepID=UPI0006EC9D8D|nr:hypothetical protein [Chthonomonas calidirosea]CEK16023.1 hypothetical protein CP488_01366 [Chthonomonas calidirosea]